MFVELLRDFHLSITMNKSIESFSIFCSYFMLFMSLCMLIACSFKTAVYGRYSTSKGWGPLIKAKIAWIIMESPNLFISIIVFILARLQGQAQATNPANKLLLLFFFIHYIHRDLIFPFKMASCDPTDMPLSVMLLAFTFCCFNGTTQALALMYGPLIYSADWILGPQFLLGSLLFVTGMYINISCDYSLLALRMESLRTDKGPLKKYSIPRGGFFECVSCANYFGEIIEWTGYAIACWSLSGWAFCFCTIANLGPRALQHHQWYLSKFDDYPKHRKAVIPFII